MAAFRIFRAKKDNTGSASSLNIRTVKGEYEDETLLFWEATKQLGTNENGDTTFAWKDKTKTVKMKLGEMDLASLLATLNGVQKESKLFHQNKNGSTTLALTPMEAGGYSVRISSKCGNDAPIAVSHTISVPEAELLRVLLQQAVIRFYNW